MASALRVLAFSNVVPRSVAAAGLINRYPKTIHQHQQQSHTPRFFLSTLASAINKPPTLESNDSKLAGQTINNDTEIAKFATATAAAAPAASVSSGSLPTASPTSIWTTIPPSPPADTTTSSTPNVATNHSTPATPAAGPTSSPSPSTAAAPVPAPGVCNSVEKTQSFISRTVNGAGYFDTFRFVDALERQGFTRGQAVAVTDQVILAIEESLTHRSFAQRQDLEDAKVSISEKVFNATLKFDMAQRYQKELVERDISSCKQDLRAEEKADVSELLKEIAALEKRILRKDQEAGERFAALHSEVESQEKRFIRYALAGLMSLTGVALAIARLVV